MPRGVQNLLLLLPSKTRPPKHGWEQFLWMVILPPCCSSLVHQLNSFSGVGISALLRLTECISGAGACLPQAVWGTRAFFNSSEYNRSSVGEVFKVHHISESDIEREHTSAL